MKVERRMKMQDMEQFLKDMELIQATEKYSLYFNRKTNEVAIYNGDDIWSISINDLGDWAFKDK
jgi:hypothetical protein